jgi:RHS repeat-associated protein
MRRHCHIKTPVWGLSSRYIHLHCLLRQAVNLALGMIARTIGRRNRSADHGTGGNSGDYWEQTGVQLPFGYTGQQQDGESGLIYLRARYYDPKTGRFLSKDRVRGSLRRPASQHAYVYAYNNPVRYTDRTGRAVDDSGDIGFDYEALPAGSGPDAPLPTPDKDVPSIESVKAEDDPLCEFDCVPITDLCVNC